MAPTAVIARGLSFVQHYQANYEFETKFPEIPKKNKNQISNCNINTKVQPILVQICEITTARYFSIYSLDVSTYPMIDRTRPRSHSMYWYVLYLGSLA